jgi:protein-S-isoprenylcysteine O-methyltransferase Ste14
VRPSETAPSRAAYAFAWGGALLFLISLSYFLYSYAVTFGRATPTMSSARALTWNVIVFTIFALHHSVFARIPLRSWVARICGPEIERSVYVWVASLLFILVCALWQPVAGVAWRAAGPVRYLLFLCQLAGIGLALRSAAIIDVFDLAGLRQLEARRAGEARRAPHPTRPSEFNAVGPYAWVRHPIYTGWILLVFAASPMTMTHLVFAVVSSMYLLVAIPFEERSLRAASQRGYERYMTQVPWKLIPRVF